MNSCMSYSMQYPSRYGLQNTLWPSFLLVNNDVGVSLSIVKPLYIKRTQILAHTINKEVTWTRVYNNLFHRSNSCWRTTRMLNTRRSAHRTNRSYSQPRLSAFCTGNPADSWPELLVFSVVLWPWNHSAILYIHWFFVVIVTCFPCSSQILVVRVTLMNVH